MESPQLKEILLQAIARPEMPGFSDDKTTTISRKELVHFLTKTHSTFESKAVLPSGVYGLVIAWLSTFERDGRPTMLGADEFAIIRFNDKIFSLVKTKLLESSLLRSYIDALSLVCCKLALLDLSYCTKSTHPARQCLNGLNRATIGLNEEEKSYAQPILSKVDNVIKGLLVNYRESADVFAIVIADLKTYISEYEKRVAVVEKRLRETEMGKYSSLRAHTYVVNHVNRYLNGAMLPTVVDEFIRGDWLASLQLALLKEGSESQTWKKMLKLTETLIWCFGARTKNELKSIYNFLRTLLNGIKNSLYAINYDERKVELTVRNIETQLIRVMKSESLSLQKSDLIEDDAGDLDETLADIPINNLRFVDDLSVGDWLILKQEEGRVKFAKLAVIISGKQCYIFVNRFGIRLLEINKVDLAIAHNEKKIYAVEKDMVFDSAIAESVQYFRKIQLSKNSEKDDKGITKHSTSHLNQNKSCKDNKDTVIGGLGGAGNKASNVSPSAADIPVLRTQVHPKRRPEISSKNQHIRLQEIAHDRVAKARTEAQARAKDKDEIDDAVLTELRVLSVERRSTITSEEKKNEALLYGDIPERGVPESNGQQENESELVRSEITNTEIINTDQHVSDAQSDKSSAGDSKSDLIDIDNAIEEVVDFDFAELESYLQEVDSINIGGWLEYQEEGKGEVKCKLAVKMKATKRMIFVDRMGGKVLDLNSQELAQMLAMGRAKIIDKGKVFDTTLEAVVKSIREEKNGKRM